LNAESRASRDEIAKGLNRLGPRTLLFLREIEEIEWNLGDGRSGMYLRGKPEVLAPEVHRIRILGQEAGKDGVEESWLVFSRNVRSEEQHFDGQAQIAFSLSDGKGAAGWSIQPVTISPLVVFFPTEVQTNLGFLVQGPYRTTPSRDIVLRDDSCNQMLVKETALLLVRALEWLRDNGHLDVSVLRCLPLVRGKFPEDNMFAPLFETIKRGFSSRRLLPTSADGYVPASAAMLARTQELRELFSPSQLVKLFCPPGELAWLSRDISQDRTPEIYWYLRSDLGISEETPEAVIKRLNKKFLEAQPDEWIEKLYAFLQGQQALLSKGHLDEIPIIRLVDGRHVTTKTNGQPNAFLPSEIETGFPIVRKSVCVSGDAWKFLEALGLTEPDPVDDIVRNVLPKYQKKPVDVTNESYAADVRRLLQAFRTDSKKGREKLIEALRDTNFVMVVDAGDKSRRVCKPGALYLATGRPKDLFDGVKDVFLVNDEYKCLCDEDFEELLVACGASRSLRTIKDDSQLTWENRRNLRLANGCEYSSGGESVIDYSLLGLKELLATQTSLGHEERKKKAEYLWEALGEVETSVFTGEYHWKYYRDRTEKFDSTFVRLLNDTPWIPDASGELRKPSEVFFEDLGWKDNSFLLSKIHFKPPILEMLAKEAGMEPGVLHLLRKLNITSEADLLERLGVKKALASETKPVPTSINSDSNTDADIDGEEPESAMIGSEEPYAVVTPSESPNDDRNVSRGDQPRSQIDTACIGRASSGIRGTDGDRADGTVKTTSDRGRERAFISYIAVHPDGQEERSDPDGLDQQARMDLEEKAILLILSRDPRLQRTKTHNPGFDLFELDGSNRQVRWVEVKAISGELTDRPVCLSRTQFDCAWKHGEAYWLYIVERAGDADHAKVLRIQDPAGKSKNFAFDHGWRQIADLSSGNPDGANA
jgi:hypothetical protein